MTMLKQLIKEVKEESKGKVISEAKQPVANISEEKELKQYVTKSLVDALRKAEK
jgi:hypothetical protein